VKHRRKHETRPPSASSPKDGGTSVIKNGGYACGECGDRFDNEDEVKSHVFTKHMCEYALNVIFQQVRLPNQCLLTYTY